jgi:anthranilate synthase/aminodeoxychorismate synthase-like glutamine amidotransferase
MVLLLDNHDSFTWNLAELLRSTGNADFEIVSSTEFRISGISQYSHIIFSPGPGLPVEQPAMFSILDELETRSNNGEAIPDVLGVCLGMQAIAIHFGGNLINLPSVVHGQPRKLQILQPHHHIFTGIPNESEVGLYHSWAVDPATLPQCLVKLANTDDGTIMALAHKTLPIVGVQFHPESVMTHDGKKMVENWLAGK